MSNFKVKFLVLSQIPLYYLKNWKLEFPIVCVIVYLSKYEIYSVKLVP